MDVLPPPTGRAALTWMRVNFVEAVATVLTQAAMNPMPSTTCPATMKKYPK